MNLCEFDSRLAAATHGTAEQTNAPTIIVQEASFGTRGWPRLPPIARIERRAEMAGTLANMHEMVARLVRNLEHIDATLRTLDRISSSRGSVRSCSGRRKIGASGGKCHA